MPTPLPPIPTLTFPPPPARIQNVRYICGSPHLFSLVRSAESLIAMSLFLSILTVFLQVSAWVHARQQAPHPCSPSTTTPLSRRIFPKHGLDPVTNLLKNAQRLPLPPTGHGLVRATFSALSPSPTKHIPAQSSRHSHRHPRTAVLTIPPTLGQIRPPLLLLHGTKREKDNHNSTQHEYQAKRTIHILAEGQLSISGFQSWHPQPHSIPHA